MRKNLLSFLVLGLLLLILALIFFPQEKQASIPEHQLQSQVDAL